MKKLIFIIPVVIFILTAGLLLIYFEEQKNENENLFVIEPSPPYIYPTDFEYDISFEDFKEGMLLLKRNPRHDEEAINFIISEMERSIISVRDPKARAVILSIYKIPRIFTNFNFKVGPGSYTAANSFPDFNIIALDPNNKTLSNVTIHEFAHFLDNLVQLDMRSDYKLNQMPIEIIEEARRNLFNSNGDIFTFYRNMRAEPSNGINYRPSLASMIKFLNFNRSNFTLNNRKTFFISDGHSESYYSEANLAYEAVACFFELKVAGQYEALEMIRRTMGNSYFNYLEDYYHKMIDTFIKYFLEN
jgi:hypothetical protein